MYGVGAGGHLPRRPIFTLGILPAVIKELEIVQAPRSRQKPCITAIVRPMSAGSPFPTDLAKILTSAASSITTHLNARPRTVSETSVSSRTW